MSAKQSRQVLSLLLLVSISHSVYGQLFSFRKVADTDTPIPGAAGNFAGGFYFPALDNGRVAFFGAGDDLEGFYADASGELTRVADSTTMLPGNSGELGFDLEPALDNGQIAFQAFGNVDGVYLYRDGAISVVADDNTLVPGTSARFDSFGFLDRPVMHNGLLVFLGDASEPDLRSGAYSFADGTLSTIADTDTPVPGQMRNFEFFEFSEPAIHDGAVAFVGNQFEEPGIYLAQSGSLQVVADTTTALPDDPAKSFFDFGSPYGGLDMDHTTIAFVSDGGIYRFDRQSGVIRTVADTSALVPDGEGELFDGFFETVSVSEGRVAFGYGDLLGGPFGPAPDPPFFGVYVELDDALQKVIAVDDALDGKIVERAWMGTQGFRGDEIAVWVEFADGTEGVYVATLVPEPATIVLILIAAAALAARLLLFDLRAGRRCFTPWRYCARR
jgi:hypothetical protein